MSPLRIARDGSPFDQRLVAAARQENPVVGAEQRALVALGLGLSLGAAGSVGTPPALRGSSSSLATASHGVLLAAALGLAGAVAAVALRGSHRPALSPVPPPAGLQATAPVSAPPVLPVAAAPAPSSAWGDPSARTDAPRGAAVASPPRRPVAAPVSRAPRAPEPASSTDRPVAVPKPPLAAEVALVQQAARALAGGEPAVALAVLDAYDQQCPAGILAEEAGLLRVQALVAKGDRDQARRVARRLLDGNPNGVVAPRIRAALDDAAGP